MNKNDWVWVLRDTRNDTTSVHYKMTDVIGAGVLRLCTEFSSKKIPMGNILVNVSPNEVEFRETPDENSKVYAIKYKVQV